MWPLNFWPGIWLGYIETEESTSTVSTVDGAMTSVAYARAYRQVYNVCMTGQDISLIKNVTKDELGSGLTESELNWHAFSVRFNPYDREVFQKIAWAEETDIICYVSKKEVDLAGISLLQLRKKYTKLRHAKKTYDIKYIEYYSAFAGSFLYVIIGGKK